MCSWCEQLCIWITTIVMFTTLYYMLIVFGLLYPYSKCYHNPNPEKAVRKTLYFNYELRRAENWLQLVFYLIANWMPGGSDWYFEAFRINCITFARITSNKLLRPYSFHQLLWCYNLFVSFYEIAPCLCLSVCVCVCVCVSVCLSVSLSVCLWLFQYIILLYWSSWHSLLESIIS